MPSVKPKLSIPKLDFSAVNINVAEAMSVQPDASDDTNELFAEEGKTPRFMLKKERPMKPKTPSSLICRHLFTYFF